MKTLVKWRPRFCSFSTQRIAIFLSDAKRLLPLLFSSHLFVFDVSEFSVAKYAFPGQEMSSYKLMDHKMWKGISFCSLTFFSSWNVVGGLQLSYMKESKADDDGVRARPLSWGEWVLFHITLNCFIASEKLFSSFSPSSSFSLVLKSSFEDWRFLRKLLR